MEDSVPATDPNVVPDELLQGAVDVSKSQDGGVQKVNLKNMLYMRNLSVVLNVTTVMRINLAE